MYLGTMRRAVRGEIVMAMASLCIGAPAHADWTGKGESGPLISSGNSDSTSANATLDVAEEQNGWKNSVHLAGIYGKNATFAAAERIEGRYELDDKISDRLYAFGAVRGERDLFSGFAYQATLSAGLGYKFVDKCVDQVRRHASASVTGAWRPEQLIKDPSGEVTANHGPVDRQRGRDCRNRVRAQPHGEHQAPRQAARRVGLEQHLGFQ